MDPQIELEQNIVHGFIASYEMEEFSAFKIIKNGCKPEFFQNGECRNLFEAVSDISDNGGSVNAASIRDWLRQNGKAPIDTLEQLIQYSMELSYGVDSVAQHFVTRLTKQYYLRTVNELAVKLVNDTKGYGIEPEIVMERIRELVNIPYSMAVKQGNSEVVNSLIENYKNGVKPNVLPLAWDNLNDIFSGGFTEKELIILAGRPATGKSAFALNIAMDTAAQGKPVLYVSLEMGRREVMARMLSREAHVYNSFIRSDRRDRNVINNLTEVGEAVGALPITIVDAGTCTLSYIRQIASNIPQLALIVVDYVQLIKPEGRSGNREQEVAGISRGLKMMAMDFGIPVLALAQLNRASETNERKPTTFDLRESGGLEQDANVVMLLYSSNEDRGKPEALVECIVAKSRSTKTGSAYFKYTKGFNEFVETDEKPAEPQPRERREHF